MNRVLTSAALIGFTTAKTWLKVVVSGVSFCLVLFFVSLYLFFQTDTSALVQASGFLPVLQALLGLVSTNLLPGILLLSSLLCPVLYVLLANKLAIETAVSMSWEQGLGSFVEQKITAYILVLADKFPEMFQKLEKTAAAKAELFKELQQDTEVAFWQRLIIRYFITKIPVEKLINTPRNDSPAGSRLAPVIGAAVQEIAKELIEPEATWLWLLAGLQFLLAVLAVIF